MDFNSIERRRFLQLSQLGLSLAAVAPMLAGCGGSSSDPAPMPMPDPDPDPQAAIPAPGAAFSGIKRTSFGVQRSVLQDVESNGVEAYLEQQLDYTNIDDGSLEADISASFPLSQQSAAQLLTGFPDNIFIIAQQSASATQYRQMFSQRQLYEVMVEFWSDHFNIHLLNGLGPTLKPTDDRDVIRQHALGNFGDLLRASARSPAMLFYLDNFFNQASAPNENYARELMELHTLGVDGGYTEADIKEVARCFTGWALNFPDSPEEYGLYQYVGFWHDQGSKVVLGQTIAANGGESDGEQVLDILANHPSTAQFIATKLCRRFINDNPDTATINEVALAFSDSNGDIKTTLRALFASSDFTDSSDQKITRPSEHLGQLIRALSPDTYPSDNGVLFFFAQNILGQLPFFWPTPDGYPDEQSYWASTSGLLGRWRLAFLSFAGRIPDISAFSIDYASMLGSARTLPTVLDALSDAILMRPLASADRDTLIDWMVDSFGAASDAELDAATIDQITPLVAAVLISSVYFHLR